MSNKYNVIKELDYIKNDYDDYDDEGFDLSQARESYENIFHKLIKEDRWEIIFKYFNEENRFKLDENQTREDCLKVIKKADNYDSFNLFQFIIKQDDDLLLKVMEKDVYNMCYVRIKLKKETLIRIDLLYGEKIEKNAELKFWYMILLEEAI